MKTVKMFALAAVAVAALMAFIGASAASASVICSTATEPCTSPWPSPTTLDYSLATGTSAELINLETLETIDTCKKSTVKGTLTNGSATATAKGPAEVTWEECTWPTTTIKNGTLEVHAITGTKGNGTVTANGFEVTINTGVFGSCVYGTGEGMDLGTVDEGNPSTFTAAAKVKFISGGFLCPRNTEWKAKYTQTEPKNTTLYVSAS
jgi:hypothetical protein